MIKYNDLLLSVIDQYWRTVFFIKKKKKHNICSYCDYKKNANDEISISSTCQRHICDGHRTLNNEIYTL